jgi:type VI protein secretion system component VasK
MTMPPTESLRIRRYIVKAAGMLVLIATLTIACLIGLWRFGSGEYLTQIKPRVIVTGAATVGALVAGLVNLLRLHRITAKRPTSSRSAEDSTSSAART